MGLLVRNGEIVTVGSRTKADIYGENETITRIGKNLDAPTNAEIIDATGKLIFPGFIDPHVHIYLPFMATFAKDTHETGSVAALIGGTTLLGGKGCAKLLPAGEAHRIERRLHCEAKRPARFAIEIRV